MLPKILLVEDDPIFSHLVRNALEENAIVLWAENIAGAEELFTANPDVDAIIMDACVPEKCNTVPLVEAFRAVFVGPIIAFSSNEKHNNSLLAAGCDHKLLKEAHQIRYELWPLIQSLLD